MKTRLTGMLAVAALAAGCAAPYSETPIATNFGTTKQQKLQAAAHWNVIAKDLARQLTDKLPANSRLHVRTSAPIEGSAFERAFAVQLTTALVQSGHQVLKAPDAGVLLVEVDTQAVPFSPSRAKYHAAGQLTALGTGLYALYEVAERASAGVAAALAVLVHDSLQASGSELASGDTPQTEIIVTASISDTSKYLARITTAYYVADKDRTLYESQSQTSVKTFQVKGAQ
ncbi:hypothetical protein [Caldimonas tepidiphila]|uniref:hypothetical protein n=1 Tax=Caldimonas tepidiphila TaxID=2315841 RepID=UPI000E5AE1EB|nr:hypothetical protein [Caldimonas tepidiphila]